MVHFCLDGDVDARVYVHGDGYPNGEHGMLARLNRFFDRVIFETPNDTRFDDPEYLAARFIVWYSQIDGADMPYEPHLDFTGIGVAADDHDDIEYIYTVQCGRADDDTLPQVTVREV